MTNDNLQDPARDDAPGAPHRQAASASQRFPDIATLSYEAARDELAEVVSSLERGQADLEQSVNLWERGESLALHCTTLLDRATARLDAASRDAEEQLEERGRDEGRATSAPRATT